MNYNIASELSHESDRWYVHYAHVRAYCSLSPNEFSTSLRAYGCSFGGNGALKYTKKSTTKNTYTYFKEVRQKVVIYNVITILATSKWVVMLSIRTNQLD